MTISDMISQLTNHMKKLGPTAQVRIGDSYNSIEHTFDSFKILAPAESKDVYLMPDDTWLKSDLKGLARREHSR